jgi:hypothetical protein
METNSDASENENRGNFFPHRDNPMKEVALKLRKFEEVETIT